MTYLLRELVRVSGLFDGRCDHTKFVEYVKLHRDELAPVSGRSTLARNSGPYSIIYQLITMPGDHADTLEFWLNAFGYGGIVFISSIDEYIISALQINNIQCAVCLTRHKSPRPDEQFNTITFLGQCCQYNPKFHDQIISSISHSEFQQVVKSHACLSRLNPCVITRYPHWQRIMTTKSANVFVLLCMISENFLVIASK